ncbi:uncharacterized protein LOC110201008 [Phascolarctos cinereus]
MRLPNRTSGPQSGAARGSCCSSPPALAARLMRAFPTLRLRSFRPWSLPSPGPQSRWAPGGSEARPKVRAAAEEESVCAHAQTLCTEVAAICSQVEAFRTRLRRLCDRAKAQAEAHARRL